MSFWDILKQEIKIHSINDELEEKIEKLTLDGRPILVGMCGESASGKTTLVNRLKEKLPSATFISTDNYYKDMTEAFRKYGSFRKMVEAGHPTESSEAFQMDILRRDLENLKNGHSVQGCFYDMKTGESKSNQISYNPAPVIFAEGICTLFEEVRDVFDVKVYLIVDKEVQKRRYFEHASERGHRKEDIEEQFARVSESAEKYIGVNQKYADLVAEVRPREIEVYKIGRQFQKNKLDKEKERI